MTFLSNCKCNHCRSKRIKNYQRPKGIGMLYSFCITCFECYIGHSEIEFQGHNFWQYILTL